VHGISSGRWTWPERASRRSSLKVYINRFFYARQMLAPCDGRCNTGSGSFRECLVMTDADALATPPRRLLLATDLSSDCDRALDRSAQLAIQWDVPLHVVHALAPEPRSGAWWSPDG